MKILSKYILTAAGKDNETAMKLIFPVFAALLCLTGCSRENKESSSRKRVVSLAPSITEIVCAIEGEDLLVGRTTACDYPPEIIEQVPAIGGFGAPSLELLVSVSPTLILDVDLADEALCKKMDSLGLQRERINCSNLDDIPRALIKTGRLLDRKDQAETLSRNLRENIAKLRTRAANITNRPSVYVEIWHDPIYTVGHDSFISELIHLAGGKNLGDEVNKEFFQISPEWIVSKDPDIILCLYMAKKTPAKHIVMNRPGWHNVKAIKNSRVYDGFKNNLILRPGPRTLEGIEQLRKCIAQKTRNE
jgi:iron complex transport system substrate-binding protein